MKYLPIFVLAISCAYVTGHILAGIKTTPFNASVILACVCLSLLATAAFAFGLSTGSTP